MSREPSNGTGVEEVKQKASKVAVWWDHAKVTVIGLSILVSVLSTTYFLGSTQSTILTKLEVVSSDIDELKEVVRGLSTDQKTAMTALSSLSERVSKLEAFKETQTESVRLFWVKDWSSLVHRLESVERRIISGPEIGPARDRTPWPPRR